MGFQPVPHAGAGRLILALGRTAIMRLTACAAPLAVSPGDLSRLQECKAAMAPARKRWDKNAGVRDLRAPHASTPEKRRTARKRRHRTVDTERRGFDPPIVL